MKCTTSQGGLTVRVIVGTYTTLLAFDLTEEARVGCLGFSISRVRLDDAGEPMREPVWLTNRLRFDPLAEQARVENAGEPVVSAAEALEPAPYLESPAVFRVDPVVGPAPRQSRARKSAADVSAKPPPPTKRAPAPDAVQPPKPSLTTRNKPDAAAVQPLPAGSTELHPWQAFRYIDKAVKPGRRYRYSVIARYGGPEDLKRGPAVDLTVTTEDTRSPHTAVFFNRAAASSQDFVEKFPGIAPKASAPARRWLSRGLMKGLLDFLRRATGAEHELHVAIYEFQKPTLLRALVEARARGAVVKVVYHARKKRSDDRDETGAENAHAARKHGLEDCCRPRTEAPTGAISHNKFVVLLEEGLPVAVWTGSTNWTDGALYGQLNVGHAVYDHDVAAAYEAYFKLLDAGRTGAQIREALGGEGPQGFKGWRTVREVQDAHDTGDGVWPIFSPQRSVDALKFYAGVCEKAEVVMVCAPFELHDTIQTVLKTPMGGDARNKNKMRFLLLDRPRSFGVEEAEQVRVIDAGAGTDVSVAVTVTSPLHTYQNSVLMAKESFHHQGVHVHAKVIMADPLGDRPTVITGSANFSEGSTCNNDENTLVFRGNTAVADIYLTEFMRVFDGYHFRGKVKRLLDDKKHFFLSSDDSWSERHYEKLKGGEPDRETTRKLFAGTASPG